MVVNETLQWAALVVLAVLVLGVFRQISLWMPDATRSTARTGPEVGRRLPKRLLGEIERLLGRRIAGDGALVAFVSENCAACQALLSQVETSEARQLGMPIVVVARTPSEQFQSALEDLGLPLVLDSGQIWNESGITSTPLVVRIDEEGVVSSKGVTHLVDSIALG
jgi:hypothetical protein